MITLSDFAQQVLRPSVVQAIEKGRLDDVLMDPDVREIWEADAELSRAALARIKLLAIIQQASS